MQVSTYVFPPSYGVFIQRTMGQYAAVMLSFVAFCHVSTIGWIFFKYPVLHEYYEKHPEETPEWMTDTYRFYFHHAYFVVTTCSTNGYGDLTPDKNSNFELIFGMVVEYVGLALLGLMWNLSNILLNDFNNQRLKIEQNMKDFRLWFRFVEKASNAEFPEWYVQQLFKFFNGLYNFGVDTILYDNDYLELLPNDLSAELERTYHEAHASPFEEFFQKYDNDMCVDIIKSCEQTSYLPDTVVVERGSTCPGIYWITSGAVEYTYLEHRQVMEVLGPGDNFGSFCLLGEPSRGSFITKDICMVHFLAKHKLDEILEKYRVDALLFKEEALEEFKQLQEIKKAYKVMLKMGRFVFDSRGDS